MSHTQPDWLSEWTAIESCHVDPNLARGMAYGLVFVMPMWVVIIGSIVAF
jgi:hypothetical protein